MNYGSVCSGIEAATVAWEPLGWKAAFYSEIEPFPCAVLQHHYPQTPNYGDMTKYKEWPNASIDVLVGGTPCQSFSVAGLRKGLADPRGNLMLVFGAVASRYRPAWLVWENVPGVLSSNGGRDFGTLLGMLGELGYGFAYRVFDAQYVRVESHRRAVPQRRRRVFVVGYFGDWRRAAAVLFERESLSGDSPPSRETGQVAPTIPSRSSACGGLGTDFDCDGGLIPQPYAVANCLTQRMHKGINTTLDEGQTPVLAFHHNAQIDQTNFSEHTSASLTCSQQEAVCQYGEVAGSLTARHDSSPCADRGQNVVVQPIAWSEELTPSVEVAGTIQYGGQGGRHDGVMDSCLRVRRLLPEECETLQGFPRCYTRIPWRGKSADHCPDGPRYKALGNSMATNVMRHIGDRIKLVNQLMEAT